MNWLRPCFRADVQKPELSSLNRAVHRKIKTYKIVEDAFDGALYQTVHLGGSASAELFFLPEYDIR